MGAGCPAGRIEVNRKLYMNEETLELHQGCEPLRRGLRSMVEPLLRTGSRRGL